MEVKWKGQTSKEMPDPAAIAAMHALVELMQLMANPTSNPMTVWAKVNAVVGLVDAKIKDSIYPAFGKLANQVEDFKETTNARLDRITDQLAELQKAQD